ncbi:MAG: preprotein translocase subunit SecY [Clostridia bacterium]|nr:preprotein translocase subunit SecY [Clostridia bacterium]
MFKTFINAFKVKDLRKKMLITLLLLFIYRVGCWLTVPGINPEVLGQAAAGSDGITFLSLMNSISGGALANASFLALGVSPYISASIIIQLLSVAIPSLERLSKQGEEGRKKMNLYTRIAALVLATAQAIGIVVSYANSELISPTMLNGAPTWLCCMIIAVILIAGAMFTVWLGERITDLGVGNGLSLLIFVGILSSACTSLLTSFTEAFAGDVEQIWKIVVFAVAVIAIFGLIAFIDSAERKVPVQYAKQIKGRKMYGGQTTNIPIKVNASGVIPIIFANALISFPQMLISIFWPNTPFADWWNQYMGTGSWLYIVLSALLILFFAYFYAQITFNPEDVSKRIQQNGGFIPGIRAGKPTAEYLGKISSRLTLFGAIYLAFIALIPSLAFNAIATTTSDVNLINAFSATGLMIVVSVALELDKQLEAQILMRNYRGFLK